MATENMSENEKLDINFSGSLDYYKYLPVPSLELFIETMKQMNIKIYDDIILYS